MKFLVGDGEAMFREKQFIIVEADDQAGAEEAHIEYMALQDPIFNQYLGSRSLDDMPSLFLIQTEQERRDRDTKGRVNVSDSEFERRVRVFFSEWPDYADTYLAHYHSDEKPPEIVDWPLEMKVMIWKAVSAQGYWQDVVVVPFGEIPHYE